eukprot:1136916-Pelagomonas_calceolata.AAC.2
MSELGFRLIGELVRHFSELGFPVQGHGDFYTLLTLGIVCHGCIAPKVSALWNREAAGHLSLVARNDDLGGGPNPRFLHDTLWAFTEAPITIALPSNAKPAQEGFHAYEAKEGRECITLNVIQPVVPLSLGIVNGIRREAKAIHDPEQFHDEHGIALLSGE